MSNTDLILVGGGLANTLIALRLAEIQPSLNVVMLEQAPDLGGRHTWSFHGSDLTAAEHEWIKPLITYNWGNTTVRFPELDRILPGSYHSITSEQLAQVADDKIGDRIWCDTSVFDTRPDGVTLADGTKISATAVIDGTGATSSPHLDVRFQKFVGWIVELESPHGLTDPIIMDATMIQDDGYRFFSTLPFSENILLIEETHYSDGPSIETERYGDEIARYATSEGWRIVDLLRTEEGVLPITLGGNIHAYWDEDPTPVARSGLRAALFHPSTGYSLPSAVALADKLATLEDWSAASVYHCTRQHSTALWQHTAFYRAMNRRLFLAAEPAQRRQIMQRLYGLDEGLIARFYAGQNTLFDKARILAGKPPAIKPAFQSVFSYNHQTSIAS
ncbi:MAG: lycopene beta-cyclase CrtY [Gammaproteobacteria bacterium]|nr:MAG: lycopene beta-cyclase CrtY [Gammaproteobacteria bacterium]